MSSWKVYASSLATTLGIAYVGCAIFDILFPVGPKDAVWFRLAYSATCQEDWTSGRIKPA